MHNTKLYEKRRIGYMLAKYQVIAFADKVYRRRREGEKIVNIYELDEQIAFVECSVLRFDTPNEAWLDFVSENRSVIS